MQQSEIFEGVVERVDFPNKGILTAEIMKKSGDGTPPVPELRKVMVKNVIPGQKIRYYLSRRNRSKCEGRLLEVVEKAPEETKENPCAHFGVCGSCLYQTMSYEAQLELKKEQVLRLLTQVVPDLPFEGVFESPDRDCYRNKMEYTFGDEYKDGPMALGMHRRGSFYDILTTGDCRIVHPDFKKIQLAALQYFTGENTGFYHKVQRTGYLRYLLVRRAAVTGEILVSLVTTSQMEKGEEERLLSGFKDALLALETEGGLEGRYAGILHTVSDSLSDAVKDEGTEILYGHDFFYEELLGLRFRITPFSFFQTNSRGAEVLYSKVREYAGDVTGLKMYDLYSGTGTIAQILAPVAEKVYGVEIVPEAVEAARENAAANGLSNCEFIAGDVMKVVEELPEKPDIIILDPPRDGIHPKAIGKIIDFGVEQIVYVSCKPTSLQRDLVIFREAGYEVKRCCSVDMFPYTGNLETVVLLSKGNISSQNVRVEFSLEDMDMSGFQQGATYEQIQKWVQEKYGFHVTHLNIAQVKRKSGIIERENYNKPKSEDSRQPGCPEEKRKAIEEALKAFRMI